MSNSSLEEVFFVEPIRFSEGPEIRFPYKLELYKLELRKKSLERELTNFLLNNDLKLLLNFPKTNPNKRRSPQELHNSPLLDFMGAVWGLREKLEIEISKQSQPSNRVGTPRLQWSNDHDDSDSQSTNAESGQKLIEVVNNFYDEAENILLETVKILYQFYFPQEGVEIFEYRLQNLKELKQIFTKDYGHVEIPFVWQVSALIQDLPPVADPQKFKQDSEVILKIFESLMPPKWFYKALAIAHGANLIDESAKKAIRMGPNDLKPFEKSGIQTNYNKIPEIVFRVLQGDTSVVENPQTWAQACEYRPPFMDVQTLLELVENIDLESIILAGLKLKNRIHLINQKLKQQDLSPEEKISAYQDCISMLCLYGPLVEIAGFRDFASEFMSVALEFLNRQRLPRNVFTKLEQIYAIGRLIYNEAGLVSSKKLPSENIPKVVSRGFALILKNIITLIVGKTFGNEFITVGHSNPSLDTLSSRLKSFGSFLQKITKYFPPLDKLDPSNINVGTPDQIGLKVIIPQAVSNEEISNFIIELITAVTQLNLGLSANSEWPIDSSITPSTLQLTCTIAHTREGAAAISFINCNTNGFSNIQEQIKNRFPHLQIVYEKRGTEYKAIHFNIVITVSSGNQTLLKIGCEIQIVGEEDNCENNYGIASHAAYKARVNTSQSDEKTKSDFMKISCELFERHREFYKQLKQGPFVKVRLCSRAEARLYCEFGIPLYQVLDY